MANTRDGYVDVLFDGNIYQKTEPLFQYDHGIALRVRGQPSNNQFQIHCSAIGQKHSLPVLGRWEDDVQMAFIPDAVLTQDKDIVCYIYLENNDVGITVYKIDIPVIPRAMPGSGNYTPEQTSNYDVQASNLSSLIEETSTAIQNANTAAASADSALQQAIQDIQAESQTQKEAVTAEGTRVLGTIPNDYTAMAGDVDDIKSTITDITGNTEITNWSENKKYIKLDGDTATVDTPTTATGNVHYAVVSASEGDEFTITATGGSASRAYGFVASDGTILKKAGADATLTKEIVTAPANTAYLVINDESFTGRSYVGGLDRVKIEQLESGIKHIGNNDYFTSLILCPDVVTGETQRRRFIKRTNSITQERTSATANNVARTVFFTGSKLNVFAGGAGDAVPTANQLVDVALLTPAETDRRAVIDYYIDGKQASTNSSTSGFYIYYCTVSEEVVTVVSRVKVSPMTYFARSKGFYRHWISIPSGATHFALGVTTNHNGCEFCMTVELSHALVSDEQNIAPVINQFVADTDLYVNDYRIINGKLYRVTADIAQGGAITPGTNCVAETVCGEVSDLKSAIGTVPTGKTVQGQIDENAGEVSELKSTLQALYANATNFPDSANVIIGYTINNSGEKTQNAKRALIERWKYRDSAIKALGIVSDVYDFLVGVYTSTQDSSFVRKLTDSFTHDIQFLPDDANYFTVAVTRKDNANIASSEADAIRSAVLRYGYIDTTLSKSGFAADAKTTGDSFNDLKSALDITNFALIRRQASAEQYLSFLDGAEGMPVNSASIHFGLYQSGTGEPSSENVRNISSATWLKTVVSGKNLLGGQALKDVFVKRNPTGITWNESTRTLYGNASVWSGKNIVTISDNLFKPNTRYTIIFTLKNTSASSRNFSIKYTNGTTTYFGGTGVTTKKTIAIVTASGKTVSAISGRNSSGITTMYVDECAILEGAHTVSDFEAFHGAAYICNLPDGVTVVEGTWDVLGGTFTTEYGYISSYNDETLPGEWVSNKAVYAEGTTPPIGAQVAYKLTEPVVYNVTPQIVRTVDGENHVSGWTTGSDLTEVQYIAQTKYYIDNNIKDTDAMIAYVEQAKAIKAHEIGDLFVCGNMLLKATAAIAVGETIIVGVGGNAEMTTIADEILAILSQIASE